jgi:tetratricopeptide (TPR) repeat protein
MPDTSSTTPELPPEARAAFRDAMDLHTAGEIDAALAAAESVIQRWPGFGEALSYLGQTLVTRKRRFADGLAVLAQAVAASPDDPYVLYSAGWCTEFVAEELRRPKRAHQPVEGDAAPYYAAAKALFLRALALEPDEKLRGDVEDMLSAISNATGEPWDEGLIERAAPRPR